MKRICCPAALGLLVVLGWLGYQVIFVGETRPAEDGRSALLLEPGERDLVLAEMRAFLESVQIITQAVSDGNLDQAAEAARRVGMDAAHQVPVSLMAKLPIGFKQLGHATHGAFDQLALDAEQLGDAAHTLGQLADLQANCVGCHTAFRIEAAE